MLELLYHMAHQSMSRQSLVRIPEPAPVMVGKERCETYSQGASAQNLLAVFEFCLDLLEGSELDHARCLDLACGSGQFMGMMAERFPGWELTGIDASLDMLDQCREHLLSRQDAYRFHCVEGNIYDLSTIPDHYYHITTWTMAAHHTESLLQVSQVVSEMIRITHPDGIVLVQDLGRLKTADLQNWYIRWAGKEYDAALKEEFSQSMAAAYSNAEFAALAESLAIPGLEHYAAFGLPVLQILYRPARVSGKRPTLRKRPRIAPNRSATVARDYRQISSLFRLSGLQLGQQRIIGSES